MGKCRWAQCILEKLGGAAAHGRVARAPCCGGQHLRLGSAWAPRLLAAAGDGSVLALVASEQRGLAAPPVARAGRVRPLPGASFLLFANVAARTEGHHPVGGLAKPPGPGKGERLVAVDTGDRGPEAPDPHGTRPSACPPCVRLVSLGGGWSRAPQRLWWARDHSDLCLAALRARPPCGRPRWHPWSPVAEDAQPLATRLSPAVPSASPSWGSLGAGLCAASRGPLPAPSVRPPPSFFLHVSVASPAPSITLGGPRSTVSGGNV